MLVLSRKLGESIKIGYEVTVTVLGMRAGQVRIGVTAPKSLAFHRGEVYECIRAQKFIEPSPAEVLRPVEA